MGKTIRPAEEPKVGVGAGLAEKYLTSLLAAADDLVEEVLGVFFFLQAGVRFSVLIFLSFMGVAVDLGVGVVRGAAEEGERVGRVEFEKQLERERERKERGGLSRFASNSSLRLSVGGGAATKSSVRASGSVHRLNLESALADCDFQFSFLAHPQVG